MFSEPHAQLNTWSMSTSDFSPLFTYSTDFATSHPKVHPAYMVRRQHSAAATMRRQTSVVENTIPLTTTFVNRMSKRREVQQQQQQQQFMAAHNRKISDPEYIKRKVPH
jgi:hypothetical protein